MSAHFWDWRAADALQKVFKWEKTNQGRSQRWESARAGEASARDGEEEQCVCVCLSISVFACFCACISVSVCLCVSVCQSLYVSLFASVCLGLCVSLCVWVCMCVCVSGSLSVSVCACRGTGWQGLTKQGTRLRKALSWGGLSYISKILENSNLSVTHPHGQHSPGESFRGSQREFSSAAFRPSSSSPCQFPRGPVSSSERREQQYFKGLLCQVNDIPRESTGTREAALTVNPLVKPVGSSSLLSWIVCFSGANINRGGWAGPSHSQMFSH